MIEIPLSRGLVALADNEDEEELSLFKWHVAESGKRLYAVTRCNYIRLKMHRLIMRAQPGTVVHHINNDGLDNRRSNLAVVSPAANTAAHFQAQGAGGHIHKTTGRYRAQMRLFGERLSLGMYTTKEEADAVVKATRDKALAGLW